MWIILTSIFYLLKSENFPQFDVDRQTLLIPRVSTAFPLFHALYDYDYFYKILSSSCERKMNGGTYYEIFL